MFWFEVLEEFYTLVKPSCPLSYITRVKTGINDSDLKDKQIIEKILVPLSNFIQENIIITHNTKFDYRVLKENFKKHNLKLNDSQPFNNNSILLGSFLISFTIEAGPIIVRESLSPIKALAIPNFSFPNKLSLLFGRITASSTPLKSFTLPTKTIVL